jgi:nucleoside-diphosphate-sugar epimerase
MKWWQADIADLEQVEHVISEVLPEKIVHLASHVAGAPGAELVLPTLRSNLLGTVNVLLAAAESKCRRVVTAGTMVEPNEGDLFASSPYAASKWAASTYVRMFHGLYGVPVVNLRVFMVYGPGQRDLRKLIPHVIVTLLKGEVPRLAGGRWPVDWVYVDDVVDAFIAALAAPDAEGHTLDVGSGKLVSIRDVVARLVEIVGVDVEPEFGALPDRPFERSRRANLESSRTVLAWSPKTMLDEGLKKTVEWYAESLRAGTLEDRAHP